MRGNGRRRNGVTYPIRVRACALVLRDDSVLLIEFTDANGTHYNLPAARRTETPGFFEEHQLDKYPLPSS